MIARRSYFIRILVVAIAAPSIAGAQSPRVPRLEVDSTEFHLRLGGNLAAAIPFRYVNGADVASLPYCINAPVPALEKRENGTWKSALATIVLTCLSQPPFRIAAHAEYKAVLDASGGSYGSRVIPQWLVRDIPGEYRLHWVLHAGTNPSARNSTPIDVVSQTFWLVLPAK